MCASQRHLHRVRGVDCRLGSSVSLFPHLPRIQTSKRSKCAADDTSVGRRCAEGRGHGFTGGGNLLASGKCPNIGSGQFPEFTAHMLRSSSSSRRFLTAVSLMNIRSSGRGEEFEWRGVYLLHHHQRCHGSAP